MNEGCDGFEPFQEGEDKTWLALSKRVDSSKLLDYKISDLIPIRQSVEDGK